MKEFTISGQTHYVFESTTEAIELLSKEEWSYLNVNNQNLEWGIDLDGKPKSPFKLWTGDLCRYDDYKPPRIGDWVRSDDGYIIQIQNVWVRPQTMPRKLNGRTEQVIHRYAKTGDIRFAVIVKTVTGTYNCINKANGSFIVNKMIVNFLTIAEATRDRGSLATEPREMGKHLTMRKKLFAYYCVVFLNPIKAFWEVNNYRAMYIVGKSPIQYRKVVMKALELLKDEYVVKEIKTYMSIEDFKNKLKDAIKNEGMGVERAVQSLKKGLDAVEKNDKKIGGLGHLGFLKATLDINKFVDDMDAKSLDTLNEEKGSISKATGHAVALPSQHAENMALPMPKEEIRMKVSPKVIEQVKVYNENLKSNSIKPAEFKDVV